MGKIKKDKSRSKPALRSNISILNTNDRSWISSAEIKKKFFLKKRHFAIKLFFFPSKSIKHHFWSLRQRESTSTISNICNTDNTYKHIIQLKGREGGVGWRGGVLYKSLRIHWIQKRGPEWDREKASLARLSWFGSAVVGWWVFGFGCVDTILH